MFLFLLLLHGSTTPITQAHRPMPRSLRWSYWWRRARRHRWTCSFLHAFLQRRGGRIAIAIYRYQSWILVHTPSAFQGLTGRWMFNGIMLLLQSNQWVNPRWGLSTFARAWAAFAEARKWKHNCVWYLSHTQQTTSCSGGLGPDNGLFGLLLFLRSFLLWGEGNLWLQGFVPIVLIIIFIPCKKQMDAKTVH